MNVTIQISTSRARVWIAAMAVVALIVGRARAYRWAEWGARRFSRWRIAGGRWRSFL